MIKKLMLATGFAAGYVAGAKAGTQRYEEIVAKAREIAGMPAVQGVTSNLTQTASSVADAAKTKANDTISGVNDKVSGGAAPAAAPATPVVDLTAPATPVVDPLGTAPLGGTTVTGYDTGAAPRPGAAASDTV